MYVQNKANNNIKHNQVVDFINIYNTTICIATS